MYVCWACVRGLNVGLLVLGWACVQGWSVYALGLSAGYECRHVGFVCRV